MLTIRNEQFAALAEASVCDFSDRMCRHLRAIACQGILPADEATLARQVRRGLDSGRRFFGRERELARYLELLLLQPGGWQGGDHPEDVMQILRPAAVAPSVRLDNFQIWQHRQAGRGA